MAAIPRILHLHHSVCCNFTPLWNLWMYEHSALKCKTKVAMAPRPILVFSATTSRLFQSDPVGFQLLKWCHQQRLEKVFMGSFSWNGTRSFILYQPHIKTREKIWWFWSVLAVVVWERTKALESCDECEPSVESWTRASRSQVTRTEIYVFINDIYFGCWFGISEFIIFSHIKTVVQVLEE